MIKPTVGRVVWFHPAFVPDSGDEITLAAIICAVHTNTLVNLAVFNASGNSNGREFVLLYQGSDEPTRPTRPAMDYCEWMPYQIGQAAKHEVETLLK